MEPSRLRWPGSAPAILSGPCAVWQSLPSPPLRSSFKTMQSASRVEGGRLYFDLSLQTPAAQAAQVGSRSSGEARAMRSSGDRGHAWAGSVDVRSGSGAKL